jgi:HSP20 family protein
MGLLHAMCPANASPSAARVALPAEVDESKAKASMKDGMLELTLPKIEKARRRTITIS